MRLIDADLFDKELKEYSDAHYDEEFYTCESIRDMLEDAPTVNPYEWISVEDRLPEEKINCLVYYKHAYCNNDGYWAIGMSFYDGSKFQIDWMYKVTHWMPIPEPPVGKEN
jgi:hypothetical protein